MQLHINEVTEQQLHKMMDEQQRRAVFIFTPLCGTCQATEKMLQVVQASGKAMPITKLNINYAATLRERWQVQSVPCLIILQGDTVVSKHYALHGAAELFLWLKQA